MMEAILAGLFGLLIGSFLNVCIYRMPDELSVAAPRSFCPECRAPVAWYDNIPVLSWILLKRRCRHCGWAIPWRYPLVEFLTGASFFAAVALFGVTPQAGKVSLLAALCVGLVFVDLEARILPDEFTLGGTAAGLLLAYFVPMSARFVQFFVGEEWGPRWLSVGEAAFGAMAGGGALYLMGWLYLRIRRKEGLGLGDVKMVAMIGAFLGLYGVLVTVLIGSVLGSVLGFAYIRLAGKDASSYELPFGSFLGVGAIFAAFFLAPTMDWYSGLGG
jgi:leader peptidase (prepilin peptidase) / N-methyltransferase